MKLFLNCRHCGNKIFLNSTARNRTELANTWGHHFYIRCNNNCLETQYSVYDVFAETSSDNTLSGLILGGVLGLLGGPTGALFGSTIGGTLGYNSDENKRRIVDNFNRSRA